MATRGAGGAVVIPRRAKTLVCRQRSSELDLRSGGLVMVEEESGRALTRPRRLVRRGQSVIPVRRRQQVTGGPSQDTAGIGQRGRGERRVQITQAGLGTLEELLRFGDDPGGYPGLHRRGEQPAGRAAPGPSSSAGPGRDAPPLPRRRLCLGIATNAPAPRWRLATSRGTRAVRP